MSPRSASSGTPLMLRERPTSKASPTTQRQEREPGAFAGATPQPPRAELPPRAAGLPARASIASVLRRALVLVCALVLIQETSLGSLFLGAACPETCPDDTAPGHCPPTCSSCACGTHANPATPLATRLPAPASSDGHQRADAAVPPTDTFLPEILHVPKPLLA